MYITGGFGYYRGSEQRAQRGDFLILVQSKDRKLDKDNFRAFVRKVSLRQLGHFMMGLARVHGQTISISGAYGSDGLPKTVDDSLFEKATPVPEYLYDLWAHGNGWNGAGTEARAMKEWATETFIKNRRKP